MLLFSVNFSCYYLLLLGRIKDVFSAELRTFIAVVGTVMLVVTLNTRGLFDSLGEAIRHVAFTVASLISTTGFATENFDAWPELSRALLVLIMFIGACAGSTGGGMKVTTVAVLLLTVLSVLRGEEDITAAKRRLPAALVRRALTIVTLYVIILLMGTMVISLIEGDSYDMLDVLFECTSALATVGVSSIGTPRLHPASKMILAVMMYLGRVGPLTMALALARRQGRSKARLRYPEETITIG